MRFQISDDLLFRLTALFHHPPSRLGYERLHLPTGIPGAGPLQV
jgi:hypothetical protein